MHQFINKEQKKLEELEHLDTGDVDLQTAKEFLLASHTRLILRIKKWAESKNGIIFDEMTLEGSIGYERFKVDLLKYLTE